MRGGFTEAADAECGRWAAIGGRQQWDGGAKGAEGFAQGLVVAMAGKA